MKEKEKNVMIAVPEKWLQSLLKDALEFDEVYKDWNYDNVNNNRIFNKAIALMGYAKSAKSILDHNERRTD